jgi:steroid delta-isomerase-like uncharacterized protein
MPDATPVAERLIRAANSSNGSRPRSGLVTHTQSVDNFNAHDADAVAMAYAADAVVYDPVYPEPLQGRAVVRDDYEAFFRSHPDARVEIRRLAESEGMLSYEMVLTGTHTAPLEGPAGAVPPSRHRLELPMAVFVDVDELGQYREVRRYYDVSAFLQHLGIQSGG